MFFWFIKWIFPGPLLRLIWRPKVTGIEYVPKEGPAILASNHVSFSDSVFLPLITPRHITFLAKAEYFNSPGVKGFLSKHFFRAIHQEPVERSVGRASEAIIHTATRILGEGKLLGIYPEGTRSPDGHLYRGKTGVARMVLAAGVPVIPVAMIGTFEIQPTGKIVPKLGRVRINIGQPLDFSQYEDRPTDPSILRLVTDEIMDAIAELSGQKREDMYAQRAKELRGASEASQPVPKKWRRKKK